MVISIFAFDVSQKLRDARAKGDKISFLLEAISNSSSEISFLSTRERPGAMPGDHALPGIFA